MKPEPPKPPPMRQVKNGDTQWTIILFIAFVLGAGILIGLCMH